MSMSADSPGNQQRALEAELMLSVFCLCGCWELKPGRPSARLVCTGSHQTMSPALRGDLEMLLSVQRSVFIDTLFLPFALQLGSGPAMLSLMCCTHGHPLTVNRQISQFVLLYYL